MKKILIYSILILFLTSCEKQKTFLGEISINEKPRIDWVTPDDSNKGPWDAEGVISITLNNGTKTDAVFSAEGSWPGIYFVLYRNSYPSCKNKVVYVSGIYDSKGRPYINWAVLEK